ncbi:metallophosphoesterase family protein [Desulfobacula toluolica]|uniref:Metallophosphoesterase n=1 Tax=Desulfobacula toluolica (strain DSM 7467 / Tol2) TaxID=651182 RepID=K0NK28_DESTT|nr:metallophosphoesterase family protein [Desulfobacula toluolica]CCK81876.1 metallophosphoesterase [Desulfobacula toluolica Tol2]
MRLAVISDVHSNLDAFQAVMADISTQAIDDIISLGDNIGYGAQPEEVIAGLKRHDISSVLGNHELALLDKDYLATFNPYARKALVINQKKLSDPAKYYVSTLKFCLVRYGCRFVHGVPPDNIARYVFHESDKRLIQIMELIKQRIAFVGHTHQLRIYELDRGNLKKKSFMKSTVPLEKNRRYIINSGSVGQPRDGYNEAKYVVWDSVRQSVTSRFVPYDYHAAAKKIKKAGIPGLYADQLEKSEL